jgi:hypothetical protein
MHPARFEPVIPTSERPKIHVLNRVTTETGSFNTLKYSGTSVHERLSSRTKKSRVTNGVSSNEHASRQQRLATSWEYRRESVSCCVRFAQFTSPLEFAVNSLQFHCVKTITRIIIIIIIIIIKITFLPFPSLTTFPLRQLPSVQVR